MLMVSVIFKVYWVDVCCIDDYDVLVELVEVLDMDGVVMCCLLVGDVDKDLIMECY